MADHSSRLSVSQGRVNIVCAEEPDKFVLA